MHYNHHLNEDGNVPVWCCADSKAVVLQGCTRFTGVITIAQSRRCNRMSRAMEIVRHHPRRDPAQ